MLEEAVNYVKFLQLQIKVRTKWNFVDLKIYFQTQIYFILDVLISPGAKFWWPLDVCAHCLQWNGHRTWSEAEYSKMMIRITVVPFSSVLTYINIKLTYIFTKIKLITFWNGLLCKSLWIPLRKGRNQEKLSYQSCCHFTWDMNPSDI